MARPDYPRTKLETFLRVLFVCVSIGLIVEIECSSKAEVLPLPKGYVVKHSKNTQKGRNVFFFNTAVYPVLKKEECGRCKKFCHLDKQDLGGITCAGVAINYNKQWFVKNINSYVNCVKNNFGFDCGEKSFEMKVKKLYIKKYARKTINCGQKAFPMILDSAVLEGYGTAIRHLQKSSGLKADGLFGKNTLKACQDANFNPKAFTAYRIARFKRLKQCPRYCRNWIGRAKRKLAEFNL